MNVEWRRAPISRAAFYADWVDVRLYVTQTVRSARAHGIVGAEFQALVGGVRIGEFQSCEAAQIAAICAAQQRTSKKPS